MIAKNLTFNEGKLKRKERTRDRKKLITMEDRKASMAVFTSFFIFFVPYEWTQ